MWLVIVIILLMLSTLANNSRSKNIAYLHQVYYYRGYYNNKDIAENSMSAFNKCIEKGYGIELDVQLTKDEQLVVFHDDSLKRMANIDITVTNSDYEELAKYCLLNTNDHIPLFEDVLKANINNVPIYIEIKDFSMHYQKLVDKIVALCDKYPGNYIFCSFNVIALIYLRKIRPELLRGVIVQRYKKGNYLKGKILENMFLNFLVRPDIISYEYDKANWSLKLNKLFNNTLAGWAISSYDEYLKNDFYDMCVVEKFDYKTGKSI